MSALNTQIGGSHYKDCAIQPIQYIEANKLQFLEGCVVKRVTRHDKPTGKGLQDINKAIHELELIREVRYGKQTQPQPATPARAEELQVGRGAQQSDYPHEEMDSVAKDRYRVTPSSGATFLSYAVKAGDGDQEIYRGRKSDCEAVARRLRGAFLDGGFVAHSIVAASAHPQPIDDGWIEWGGGDQAPVPPDSHVVVLYRDGAKALAKAPQWLAWTHSKDAKDTNDIIAYRPAKEQA